MCSVDARTPDEHPNGTLHRWRLENVGRSAAVQPAHTPVSIDRETLIDGQRPLRMARSSASAPALSSGSLPLPHLGDCTQLGHPRWHGHRSITARVASRWRGP